MVHNGIEYGLMQLISETYDLLRRGLDLSDSQLQTIYGDWNRTELNSYLLEITSDIFGEADDTAGGRLIDNILDSAKQKGTGKWTSQDAMELGIPTPTIDAAVAMRNMSALKADRETASEALSRPKSSRSGAQDDFVEHARRALYVSMIMTFTQGMAQLRAASEAYEYGLSLQTIAKIWRGGCIIRAGLLEEIRQAYEARPDLPSLLLHGPFEKAVTAYEDDLRFIVGQGIRLGIPVAAFSASLAYLDAYRSAWLPANLIQAQRDYFGAHTYERVDEKGVFHTQWEHPAE
jgi:6-phosphogluconate dehydrogenase